MVGGTNFYTDCCFKGRMYIEGAKESSRTYERGSNWSMEKTV
jgi:hypothetical protein